MRDIYKAMLIGLSSRVLVILVVALSSALFVTSSLQPAIYMKNPIPIVNSFDRFDSNFYYGIAISGYPTGYPKLSDWNGQYICPIAPHNVLAKPQWAFFPLYPAAIKAASLLLNPFFSVNNAAELAGFIVSNVAFFFSIYFFYKLTVKILKQPRISLVASAFFSFYAGSMFYSAIYSEALFMALALGAFYFLEEDKLPIAVLLGFLAAFTRSDGFLICIPFFVYAIQSIKNKQKAIKLVAASAIAASPFLIFQLAGYLVAGHVFPITLIAHNLNFGLYPPVTTQLAAYFHETLKMFTFDIVAIALMFLPAAHFIYKLYRGRIKNTLIQDAEQLKYWALYASFILVIVFDSNLDSVVRYSVPMLPIYWVSALIYTKNRKIGLAMFALMTGMLIVGSFLFETGGGFL